MYNDKAPHSRGEIDNFVRVFKSILLKGNDREIFEGIGLFQYNLSDRTLLFLLAIYRSVDKTKCSTGARKRRSNKVVLTPDTLPPFPVSYIYNIHRLDRK